MTAFNYSAFVARYPELAVVPEATAAIYFAEAVELTVKVCDPAVQSMHHRAGP